MPFLYAVALITAAHRMHAVTTSGRACPACWIHAAVVRVEPDGRAPEEPIAVADSTVELVAELPVRCVVAAQVRYAAGFCSCPTDRHDCSVPFVLARIESVAERCLAPHSDDHSALEVRTSDSRPGSLPAYCLVQAGSEQADSSQADCCQDDYPDGYCRHDCCHRGCYPDGCWAGQVPGDCWVEHFPDGRSELAARTNDSHPYSLPAGCSEQAGSESADSSRADCCRGEYFPGGCYHRGCCRPDCCHRGYSRGDCSE